MKTLLASIAFSVLSSSVAAADNGVLDHVRNLAALLSDVSTDLHSESTQIKKATLVQDGVVKNAWVVLFKSGSSQAGRGVSQYVAVFEENPKADPPAGATFNAFSLVNFMKVGDEQSRVFETFSAFGEYLILKGGNVGDRKTADVVIRFDRNSIAEMKGP